MIDKEKKAIINKIGLTLSQSIGSFYGKITFNFQDRYVSSNVEHSVKITEPLQKGAKK